MVVDALCAVLVVGIQMRSDQNLVSRKGLLGKFQTDAVGFFIRPDFTRSEGLDILVEVDPECLAIQILRCHKFFVSMSTEAVDPADILPPVCVHGFLLLHAIADASTHSAWGLLVFGDIKDRCHCRHPPSEMTASVSAYSLLIAA